MNQKGFANIIVVIGIVILAGVVGYFIVYHQIPMSARILSLIPTLSQIEKTGTGSSFILPAITGKDSICTVPSIKETNITDINHPLVVASKKTILGLGISEDHFAKHFKLLCAVANQLHNMDSEVRWQYTIGEFTTIIEDDINDLPYNKNIIHTIGNNLGNLTEVQAPISKIEAGRSMQTCIGDFKEAELVFVTTDNIDIASGYPKDFIWQTRHTKPVLVARSVNVGSDGRWDVGAVDLQTGECSKSKGPRPYRPLLTPH